jgi:prophage regulatory protein
MRILRLPQVEAKVGLKKSRIEELEKLGEFPKRFKISERAAGWLESEIDTFIAGRVALSRRQPIPAQEQAAA